MTLRSYVRVRVRVMARVRVSVTLTLTLTKLVSKKIVNFLLNDKMGDFLKNGGIFCNFVMLNICLSLKIE